MQVILTRTKSFFLQGTAGTTQKHLTVPAGAGIQTVPDWVRQSTTFKLGVKDGSVQEVEVRSPVPTAAAPVAKAPPVGFESLEDGDSAFDLASVGKGKPTKK